MKTFKSVCAALLLSLLFVSCEKNADQVLPGAEEIQSTPNPNSNSPLNAGPITFCNVQEVPLCAGQNINIGKVTVKTGSDGNIHITYTTHGNWYLKELHLYAGLMANLPVTGSGNPIPGQFPYTKTFVAPYIVQEYTFVLSNLPNTFIVAAHAAVIKRNAVLILQEETAWGDGCNGTSINPDPGNWGTYFNYDRGTCVPAPICSFETDHFYGNTINLANSMWPDVNGSNNNNGVVTVGTFNYTENEARAIYNTANPYGTMPHCKKGFLAVSTLRLSQTNYIVIPELLVAVTTIDAVLATCGKLSPNNMPTSYYPTVNSAADVINTWIGVNVCPDRR